MFPIKIGATYRNTQGGIIGPMIYWGDVAGIHYLTVKGTGDRYNPDGVGRHWRNMFDSYPLSSLSERVYIENESVCVGYPYMENVALTPKEITDNIITAKSMCEIGAGCDFTLGSTPKTKIKYNWSNTVEEVSQCPITRRS